MRKIYHVINGERVPSRSGKTFFSENPATEEIIAEVAYGEAEDVDYAVESASKAFCEWSRLAPAVRGKLLYKVSEKLLERAEEFARAETEDSGKTYQSNLRIDVPFAAEFWRYYAGAADKIRTPVVANEFGIHRYAVREPYGVVGAIAPWNFPLVMASLKMCAPLSCGNTVVIKMAEQTPLTVTMLAELLLEVGFPPGVVNVVHGDGKTGQCLVNHPKVKKIAFTGSSAVGKLIGAQCAQLGKPALLEMGGKSANIVFADADLDLAADGVLQSGLGNNGQFCLAASRILVEESISDEFISKLLERVRRIKLGDPFCPSTNCGPLISQKQLDRVMNYIEIGKNEGAEIIFGGKRAEHLERGYFLEPTVFWKMKSGMRIWREEIFGPVIGITTFRDEEEAIELANDCDYGLGAYFWSKDVNRVHRVSYFLDSGLVFVNMPAYMVPQMPAGIRKLSGSGYNFGLEAIENYTKLKGIYINYSEQIFPWLS
ncbi:MAG: aldehyde dehydrogenase family protein [Acidobacteriota bacterium]|nr:aldehyde dehydrogenase family protein [Pyrinomonadaceae bacterium]MDW8303381.1 aldehyde dehydrogenase family protein [Acidobacteriota bacterium]